MTAPRPVTLTRRGEVALAVACGAVLFAVACGLVVGAVHVVVAVFA